MGVTTAIYARISSDPTGQRAGVERQVEDCLRLAGGPVAEYVDNDVSAYKGKLRPAYEQMLADIETGVVHEVIAWHPDRLHRQPAELERFIDLVERHDVKVRTVTAGHWDLSTPSGRMTARILGAVARQESEHKAERVRRAMQQKAENGERHGRVPYGWRAPEEAAVVRRIVTDILAGESVNGLAAALNAEGIPAAGGGQWWNRTVRQVAMRWANAGLREHNGTVVGEAKWPAIVTRDQQERVRRLLAGNTVRPRAVSKHLLTGLLRCGVCGRTLRNKQTGGGSRQYACPDFHVGIRADLTERFVLELVQGRLRMPDAAGLATPSGDAERELTDRLAALRGRLDDLALDYADGVLDRQQAKVAGDRLRSEIAETENRLAAVEQRHAVTVDPGTVLAELSPDRQRVVIAALVTVTVEKGVSGAHWTPDRLSVEWVTG